MAVDTLPEGFVLDNQPTSSASQGGDSLPPGFVVEQPKPESMQTEGVLGYAANHPFKTVLQGLPQTITGKSLFDSTVEGGKKTPMTPEQIEQYKKGWGGSEPSAFNELNVGDRFKAVGAAGIDMATAPINAIIPGAAKVVGKIAEVAKPIAENIGKLNLENRIFNLYNTSVGAKLKNVGEVASIKPQRLNAMKAISDNAENLQLPSGEQIPQNRLDLLHSLKQTKQAIWDKVTKLSGGATESGAQIDIKPVVEKSYQDTIKMIGEDKLKQDPGLLKELQQEAMSVTNIGTTTPSRAQVYMASLNKELAPNYAAAKGTNFSVLDFKRNLVNNLNDATEASIERTLNQSGYGELRDQYAALKSSEKEILGAANKYLRQEGGQGGGIAHPLVNLWSIEEAMQAGGHAVTGNLPAAGASLLRSGAIKVASKLADFMKNPDTKISTMFKLLKKYEGGIKPGTSPVPLGGS